MIKKLIGWLIFAAILFGAAFGGAYYYQQQQNEKNMSKAQSVATASLTGLQSQARLTPFIARYVAVVTSKTTKLGLSAERTMVMPGTVRYELDLKAIRPQDLKWDEKSKTLFVRLPSLQLTGPEVSIAEVREFGEGGILTMLTNAEQDLDAANRKNGEAEIMKLARQEAPMKLAREAARQAIRTAFEMPLKAAKVTAKIEPKFADEKEAE